MRFNFYLGAIGSAQDIRELNNHMQWPGSRIHAVITEPDTWCWRTVDVPCTSHLPAEELESYLDTHPDLLEKIRHYHGHVAWQAVIVCHYEPDEDPRGLAIGTRLMARLAAMGASLEIDAVPDLSDEAMARSLDRHGEEITVVIDQDLLACLQVDAQTFFEVETDGAALILTPINPTEKAAFTAALEAVNERFSGALERLSE